MSDLESSESRAGVNDLINRIYICFCQKRFTTYPGVYLHLKSKHANVFEKYKKLKITKLFRKIEESHNTEVFRLEKLSEIDKPKSANLQKNFKDNKKTVSPSFPIQESHLPRLKDQQEPNKHLAVQLPDSSQLRNPPANINPQLQMPIDHFYRNNGYSHFQHGGNNFPMGVNPVTFPPYLHYPPPMFPYPKPPIKKMLERFLYESNTDKYLLKTAIYRLMVFIDSNYEIIQDPRAKDRLFLSYCDQFDPTFIKPLIHKLIDRWREEKASLKNQNERVKIQQQIQNILKFQLWLTSIGLISSEVGYPSGMPGNTDVLNASRVFQGREIVEEKKREQNFAVRYEDV